MQVFNVQNGLLVCLFIYTLVTINYIQEFSYHAVIMLLYCIFTFWCLERSRHFNIIKDLYIKYPKMQANDDDALRYAARHGYLDIVKYLVSRGANVHTLEDAALRYSASQGHLDVVKYLVSKGAHVHAHDDWALRWAANNGHLEVVKYLESAI